MNPYARKFVLQGTRRQQDAITDASGRTGFWPFQQVISYHVGINCDAIQAANGRLSVLKRGEEIAFAAFPRDAQ